MKACRYLFVFILMLAASDTRAAENVHAISASDFLDSLGMCTHVGQGADDPQKSATALAFAGIRNIRDDASERHVKDWIAIHQQAAIKVVLTMSGPSDSTIPRMIEMSKQLAEADALLALEGPNEPNNWGVTFERKKSGGNTTFIPVAKWQAAYYAAAKADPVLKNYPVFDSSEAGGSEPDNVGLQYLTIPQGASTLMPDGTHYADFANVHNYICRKPAIIDNMAWENADPVFHGWPDGIYVEYGKTWRKGFTGYSNAELEKLPRVTTETGWVTSGKNGLTEEQQGRLYLNLYLAQFKRGFKYTFIYMLRDGGGSDAGYGIVHNDYQPKKSATYLHNLTSILADRGIVAHAGSLAYTIPNAPATVHDLLLQKSDGTFELVVWNEKAKGADQVGVELAQPCPSVILYDPTLGSQPTIGFKNVRTIALELSDHPIVIEIPATK